MPHTLVQQLLGDRYFLLALLLGPVGWSLLTIFGEAHFTPSLTARPLMTLLLLILLYPVVEELLFRGTIQPWLWRTGVTRPCLPAVSCANLITSLLFAAAHLIYQPPLWAAAVLFPSLIFGHFRDKYLTITPGIVLHIWYNLGFFTLLSFD